MGFVTGIHHVSLKCNNEKDFREEIKFYKDILGLPVAREWDTGIMFETGSGLMEIFNDAEDQLPQGVIRHFAFATHDVDALAKAVSKAGYEVFVEPKDISIPSEPPFAARIAFCKGPLGEEIEFFQEY